VPFTDRLTDTGGLAKKDRITHRVAVEQVDALPRELSR